VNRVVVIKITAADAVAIRIQGLNCLLIINLITRNIAIPPKHNKPVIEFRIKRNISSQADAVYASILQTFYHCNFIG
jgi:hypothetical protein